MSQKNITVIGCGTMGSILMERLLYAKVAKPSQLVGCDSDGIRLSALKRRFKISTTTDIVKASQKADIILLAVKPQQFQSVSQQLGGQLRARQLALSIMAGVSTKTLASQLKHKAVVRAMPNIAARVGQAMTVWYAAPKVAKSKSGIISKILSALGLVLRVGKESDIDKATAISGSGPAYWYYTAEVLEKAARAIGFSVSEAALLVRQTYLGSAMMYLDGEQNFSQLREAVTSKHGTTAAALKTLSSKKMEKIWQQAIKDAYRRAKQLSK